jgi:hypothetical protein
MTIPEYAARLWIDRIYLCTPVSLSPSVAVRIEKFGDLLKKRIEIGITGKHKQYHVMCDYDVDADLEEICKGSDLDPIVIPGSSEMWIYPDKIQYKFGYGQPIQTITLEEIQNEKDN